VLRWALRGSLERCVKRSACDDPEFRIDLWVADECMPPLRDEVALSVREKCKDARAFSP
jgi:hypothetical protein